MSDKITKILHNLKRQRSLNDASVNQALSWTVNCSAINSARCIRRVRRQKYLPASRVELRIDKMNTVTCRWEQFCLLNDITTHTGIVTWNSNLEVICRQDAELFADGTFKICVNLCEKLYIIHACINGHHMPVLVWLLTGRTEQHYNASVACNTWSFWQSVGFQVHPRSVNFDLRTVGYAAVPDL